MSKLFRIEDFRYFSSTYLETGSCMGESINRALKAGFDQIKSVEVFEEFYNRCVLRFRDKPVELFLGKSADCLPEMLNLTEPAVIFLDAHPAGPGTGGHSDLIEKGETSDFHQNKILTRELEIILSHPLKHLIILDDQTLEDAKIFMGMLKEYRFEFMDEQLENHPRVADKVLVCVPI